ncbi:MAG: threonine dehydratase [Calditrichaeota bacterium]|nr:MAG: threonine dehydratase [Calditrichota bacterium]MBL1204657.1 threonine dehydratase [Calditrichota bacterium]NOG44485.1 threonine ammonia-lyase IlvA [Calditrichota bacterium]
MNNNVVIAKKEKQYSPALSEIRKAALVLKDVVNHTPLTRNLNLSERFNSKILLKREDLQIVRSYKIRGAYNKINSFEADKLKNGIVCASAGNHAQGVAYSCRKAEIQGTIFMPVTTPQQKIKQVKMFGREYITIKLTGDSFDEAYKESVTFAEKNNAPFIHPFDDKKVIEGQGTIALEILNQAKSKIDYLFLPIGGGGLAAGVGTVFKELSPDTKIIGVEPAGAPSMTAAFENEQVTILPDIDNFVDGAAVHQAGDKTFEICKNVLDKIITVDEGAICTTILSLYNEDAIVVEPAGAMSITALNQFREEIAGKNVVCLLSGSNNDITRTEEIKERSLLYEGLKHYFIIRFPQRAGALKQFVNNVLGPDDDIAYFEYSKKTSREKGPVVVGIEITSKDEFVPLITRMEHNGFVYEYLNDKPTLFQFLI